MDRADRSGKEQSQVDKKWTRANMCGQEQTGSGVEKSNNIWTRADMRRQEGSVWIRTNKSGQDGARDDMQKSRHEQTRATIADKWLGNAARIMHEKN